MIHIPKIRRVRFWLHKMAQVPSRDVLEDALVKANGGTWLWEFDYARFCWIATRRPST